jgi:hypothetical protein
MIKKSLSLILFVALSAFAMAQDTVVTTTEREPTGLRADGKIYVVMAVALTVLIGLFIYLFRLDKRITKLEKGT